VDLLSISIHDELIPFTFDERYISIILLNFMVSCGYLPYPPVLRYRVDIYCLLRIYSESWMLTFYVVVCCNFLSFSLRPDAV